MLPLGKAAPAVPPHETAPILEVEHLRHAFGDFEVLHDCSLKVRPQEITAIIGPNGAGKSTLVNVIAGFYRMQSGSILFDGKQLGGLPPYRVAATGLIRTFQISRDYGQMTVLDNMMVPPLNQKGENLFNVFLRPKLVAEEERKNVARALELLNTFGLYDKREEYAGSLSGGQKRLLEMARALMANPKLLLLDEPMAGVNPALAERLAHHIKDLGRQGLTIVMIEHNLGIVDLIADEVVVMANGAQLTHGTMDQIRANPEVVSAYLGGA